MSYILEALKKAQAERQLGATPTIHASTLDVTAARVAARPQWQPVALALAAVAVAGLLALLWRQQGAAPGHAPVPAVMAGAGAPPGNAGQGGLPAAMPHGGPEGGRLAVTPAQSGDAIAADARTASAVGAASAPGSANGAPAASASAPASVNRDLAASASARGGIAPGVALPAARGNDAAPAPAREAVPVARAADSRPAKPTKPSKPSPEAGAATDPAGKPALAARPEPATKPKAAPPAEDVEEAAQLLRDLPEPIQRIVPPVTMSGYMYSKNPADRLVLIDKVLRREGEEVAPGLVLEKLQAKAAVFSFKGYRYRVPY